MLKGIVDKLRGKKEDGAPEKSPSEIKAEAEAKAAAVAESISGDQVKTEVIAPGHTPDLKDTVQLNRDDIKAALKSAKGPMNLAEEKVAKPSNYDTLPETVQLDKKRVQEILRQAKAMDSEES